MSGSKIIADKRLITSIMMRGACDADVGFSANLCEEALVATSGM